MFSSHGDLLTYAINHHRELTHYGETKRAAHNSQRARTIENLKLNHGGPSQRQASDTKPRIKALRQGYH